MSSRRNKQAGVSVLEATVALLVAGLVFAGMHQGQGMIRDAKATSLASEMRDVQQNLYMYRQYYKAIPGDDDRAGIHVPGATSNAAASDGAIYTPGHWYAASLEGAATQNEHVLFWNHIKGAGLYRGPRVGSNAVGGMLGITSARDGLPVRPPGVRGSYTVCSSAISGDIGRIMDLQMDDGDATSGKLWAGLETSGLPVSTTQPPVPYDDASTFTICTAF